MKEKGVQTREMTTVPPYTDDSSDVDNDSNNGQRQQRRPRRILPPPPPTPLFPLQPPLLLPLPNIPKLVRNTVISSMELQDKAAIAANAVLTPDDDGPPLFRRPSDVCAEVCKEARFHLRLLDIVPEMVGESLSCVSGLPAPPPTPFQMVDRLITGGPGKGTEKRGR